MAGSFIDPWAGDEARKPALRAARSIGMWLFLAALFVLFASSLIGYALVRYQATWAPEEQPRDRILIPVPLGTIEIPWMFWISTVLVVGVSIWVSRAVRRLRAGFQRSYRNALIAAMAMATGFVTIQTPAMLQLLSQHNVLFSTHSNNLYRLIFFFVLVHALHVLGGMVSLGWVAYKAARGEHDSANINPIRFAAIYWHFLDGVWIAMFALFMILR